ncbi:MAG: hypothetical protein HC903_18305 [Methylacidiphilales bacterium]|nr:hypothetical protein [Candidatus Methylacidiphilales bacterium]NJR15379.1 hypothetical protein [Calothrix sp. CSU_2_0]
MATNSDMHGYPYKIYQLLLGSVFILISNITFAKNANAEEPTLDVPVPSSCTLENINNGKAKLAVTSDNKTLSSTIPGGVSGIVTIECNGSATVEISQPKQNSANITQFDLGELSATAKSTALNLNIANPGSPSQTITGSEEVIDDIEVKVDMEAKKGSGLISPGEYNFTVTLTVTPQ